MVHEAGRKAIEIFFYDYVYSSVAIGDIAFVFFLCKLTMKQSQSLPIIFGYDPVTPWHRTERYEYYYFLHANIGHWNDLLFFFIIWIRRIRLY